MKQEQQGLEAAKNLDAKRKQRKIKITITDYVDRMTDAQEKKM